jgi:caa(3)-type oxidase subunit IV
MAAEAHGTHAHPNYVKIYVTLLVLFVISVLGPTLGIKAVTLITAFGIAIVKATMVAAYFMHLNIEKRYIWYLMFTMLALMLVFFAGVAPDVLKQSGTNWTHPEVNLPHVSAAHH